MNADFYTFILLSGVIVIFSTAQCAKIKNLNAANLWKLLFYLALICFGAIEFLCLSSLISYFRFEGLSSVLLALIHSLILTAIGFLSIKEFTKLKIRALWKVPMIGSLFGLLAQEFQMFVHGGLWLITSYVFVKHYNKLRILTGKILGLMVWTVALALIREKGFWYLNSVLIFFSLLTYSLWDMVVIKLLVWTQNEKTS